MSIISTTGSVTSLPIDGKSSPDHAGDRTRKPRKRWADRRAADAAYLAILKDPGQRFVRAL